MMESNWLLIPPAKCLNRGFLAVVKGGEDSTHLEGSASFLCYEKLGEFAVKCWNAVEVNFLCDILAFFAFRRINVISRREVLKILYSILFTVAEVVSRTILYHYKKKLIGSVPIGEGPGDVAQWRGWTPLSTYVCDSLILCLFYICYQSCFSFLFWAFHLC